MYTRCTFTLVKPRLICCSFSFEVLEFQTFLKVFAVLTDNKMGSSSRNPT
jgi:hypothetical protein